MIAPADLVIIVKSIVEHQQQIIGPLALDQARKVPGLIISGSPDLQVEVKTEETDTVLSQLVEKYQELFGPISIEACREAIRETRTHISPDDLPAILH
jgi:hypothetical protein